MTNSKHSHHSAAIETTLNESLDLYLKVFESLTLQSLETDLKPLWHDNVEFKDPFNHVFGKAHCTRLFEHMFTQCFEPRFTIQYKMLTGSVGSAYWIFEFKLAENDKAPQKIKGNSLIEFDADGLVIKHIDYWDAAEQFYEKIPLLGSLIRLVKKRLQVA